MDIHKEAQKYVKKTAGRGIVIPTQITFLGKPCPTCWLCLILSGTTPSTCRKCAASLAYLQISSLTVKRGDDHPTVTRPGIAFGAPWRTRAPAFEVAERDAVKRAAAWWGIRPASDSDDVSDREFPANGVQRYKPSQAIKEASVPIAERYKQKAKRQSEER